MQCDTALAVALNMNEYVPAAGAAADDAELAAASRWNITSSSTPYFLHPGHRSLMSKLSFLEASNACQVALHF